MVVIKGEVELVWTCGEERQNWTMDDEYVAARSVEDLIEELWLELRWI